MIQKQCPALRKVKASKREHNFFAPVTDAYFPRYRKRSGSPLIRSKQQKTFAENFERE